MGKKPTCSLCGVSPDEGARLYSTDDAAICLPCVGQGTTALLERKRGPDGVEAFPGESEPCSFCRVPTPASTRHDVDGTSVCGDCLASCIKHLAGRVSHKPKPRKSKKKVKLACDQLEAHFGVDPDTIVTSSRVFPARMMADLQIALEKLHAEDGSTLLGLHERYQIGTLEFPKLWLREKHEAVRIGPLQYIEIDIGEDEPRRCLKTALWLAREGDLTYAVLLSQSLRHGEDGQGVHIEVGVPTGEAGQELVERYFATMEAAIREAKSYRGKVLSLERGDSYSGRATGIRVHKLRSVERDALILPDPTLGLLERNVYKFFNQREGLTRLKMSLKKGLLFYGPPGTGKTHTIHYLAGKLEQHTTLLLTAEQVGLLKEYMALARLLQPTVVVIEDADLIAGDREKMGSPCEQVLLNQLLNEMDGLREDAEILFILTTNRPEALELALKSRPGRIDQAIEFPLPDEQGRQRLVKLYARGLTVPEEILQLVVKRTAGVSAAFIKELMRRTAQCCLDRGSDASEVLEEDVELALEEMLVSGGQLNVALLGGRETS